MDPIQLVKSEYSTGLLIFSITIVCGLIFNEQTKVSSEVHPVVAVVIMIAALIWLNMVEGGQGSLVGLPPVDRNLYVESHPTAHKGDNLDRCLMGRQFMVLLMVFTINQCSVPLEDTKVFGLPDIIIQIFLGSEATMILMTAMAGQLNSQVNASLWMLDYSNNFFAVFTLYVALAIEFSGLLHSFYLVQMFFVWASGKEIESKEPPRDGAQNLFYWGRILISLAILCYAMAVTLVALFDGKTTMWARVPNGVAAILFFLFMSIVGMLKGMQIAFFAVAKLPKEERGDHPTVYIFFQFCLFLEAADICSGAWVLASVHKAVSGFQLDEVYFGTPEERAAGMKPDHQSNRNLHVRTNVLVDEAGATAVPKKYLELQKDLAARNESYSVRRERILSNIKGLREEINSCSNDDAAAVFESALCTETAAMNKLNQEENDSAAESDEEMGVQK